MVEKPPFEVVVERGASFLEIEKVDQGLKGERESSNLD